MKQYNAPGFLATEAWKSMQEILDKEMPVEQKRRRFAFFWFLPLTLLVGGVFWYTNKHTDANKILVNSSLDKTMLISAIKTDKIAVNNKSNNSQTTLLAENTSKVNPRKDKAENRSLNFENISDLTKSSKTKTTNDVQLPNQNLNNNGSLSSKVNKEKQFAGRASFGDLRAMKIDRGETGNVTNNSTVNSEVTINSSEGENLVNIESVDNKGALNALLKTSSIATTNNPLPKTPVKVPKNKLGNSLHYGLQWNVLLPQSNSYLDYNAKSQPLSIVIPEFWVSKNVGLKSEIGLQLNPYSQYTLHSNNVLASNDYSISILQGSTTSTTTLNYVQTRSLLKAMGVELTAKYTYHLSKNFSLALGIGNNWLSAAVVNDRILGKNDKLVHDSSYGIAKGFNDWNYLKSSFFVGRFELLYQFKKLQLGLAFVKPLGDIYSFSNTNKNPINSRLVLRWKIK